MATKRACESCSSGFRESEEGGRRGRWRTDVFAGNEHLNILTRLSRDSRKSLRCPPDDSLTFENKRLFFSLNIAFKLPFEKYPNIYTYTV